MKYLFWDIDGTLLLTNKAGVSAFTESIKQRYNLKAFTFSHGLAGRTDNFIAHQAIRDIKGTSSQEEAVNLLKLYSSMLPDYLQKTKGHLLPNVQTIVKFCHYNSAYCSCILTGNCEIAGHAKLNFFKINTLFNFDYSIFGDHNENREQLAESAWQKISQANPQVTKDDVYIIGDTPLDIACAKAIGVRCLIISAGSFYDEAQLASCNPWKMIKQLPDNPQEFMQILSKEA